ncbi:MAG: HD domain-containing protein [Chloroflexota bacterium]
MNGRLPSLLQAEALFQEGAARQAGGWVGHSRHVALAARAIAGRIAALDAEKAYIFGLLHDIGRQFGQSDLRHILDGYNLLSRLGFEDAARICLTHSFPIQQVEAVAGRWDCSAGEIDFVRAYLASIEYDDYDRLIQLCDALALPDGFCLMEKRMVDVALRHGLNEYTLPRWRAYFRLKEAFEAQLGCSVYELLPGVVENTFGFAPFQNG